MKPYKELYNMLYDNKYHYSKDETHATRLVTWAIAHLKFKSVLDVGCAKGKALDLFYETFLDEISLVGVDISTAAVQALAEPLKGVQACATNLPFGDNSFELVISTDMLEHLSEEDAIKALSEMKRVASKYVLIKPSYEAHFGHWEKVAGEVLHRTVYPPEWWAGKLDDDSELIEEGGETWIFLGIY